jgi:hypothetical protein
MIERQTIADNPRRGYGVMKKGEVNVDHRLELLAPGCRPPDCHHQSPGNIVGRIAIAPARDKPDGMFENTLFVR